ncbi:MAG: nucleotidyltransferase family protein [Clostridia bacterium]|nr:nucleotidyltransferase family protein [Clostridia bacterium]
MKMQLTIVQQAVLSLLKRGLGISSADPKLSDLSADTWEKVYKECRAQTVQMICYDALAAEGITLPDEVEHKWFTVAALSLSRSLNVAAAQDELVALLEKNEVPYTILKGMSSAHYYPDSEKRCAGDIDFLVSPEYIEKATKLLTDNGYALEDKPNENHLALHKNDVWLELHHSVAGMPDGSSGELLRAQLKGIIENSVMDDRGFRRPSDMHHGIVILLHTLHHLLSSGLGLRHLCDWACFVKETEEKSFWKEELLPLLERAGLKKTAFIITGACVKYLALPRPCWLPDAEPDGVDDFMNELLRGGNFGRKDLQLSGTGMMLTKNSEEQNAKTKIKRMLYALNSTNHRVYPILDRLPWLYPFIMVWRMMRYIVLMLLGKRQSLLKASRYTDERSKLFKKFDLYKTDGE